MAALFNGKWELVFRDSKENNEAVIGAEAYRRFEESREKESRDGPCCVEIVYDDENQAVTYSGVGENKERRCVLDKVNECTAKHEHLKNIKHDVLRIEGGDLVWCLTAENGEMIVRSTVQGDMLNMVATRGRNSFTRIFKRV